MPATAVPVAASPAGGAPAAAARSRCVLAVRPGRRLWVADPAVGTVLSTLKFQALTQPTSVATLGRDAGAWLAGRACMQSTLSHGTGVARAEGNAAVEASSSGGGSDAADGARKGGKKAKKRGSKSPQFALLSRLHVAGRPMVVTAAEDSIVLLDPHPARMRVCAWINGLGRVMDVSVRSWPRASPLPPAPHGL